MDRIYLDHAATTPMHPKVIESITEALTDGWGNPSSLHSEGRKARKLREIARERVARLLECSEEELFFTGSGSESDQWAILGVAKLFEHKKGRVITSAIEHSAVRNVCIRLSKDGYDVQLLPVDKYGRYSENQLEQLLTKDTILVSLMYCNNELGTIQNIEQLCEMTHQNGSLFHTDAVQAFGKLDSPIHYRPDLISVASHKINGPKGVGALYVRKGIDFPPWITEASQERGKRPGTEPMPAIVGFGSACQVWYENKIDFRNLLKILKQTFMNGMIQNCKNIQFVSPLEDSSNTIVNVRFIGLEAESILLGLDLVGVAASAGSACASGAMKPSTVLLEVGYSEKEASECVRFSFGPSLTIQQITTAVERISDVIEKQQRVISG